MSFRFTEAERRIFAHTQFLNCSTWASRYLIVQDGIFKGSPLRMDVSPFLRGPMDAFSNSKVHEVVVCGSLQVGKTLFLYSCLGWSMVFRPGIKMLCMPTKDTRDRVRDKKLVPLLKGSAKLRKLVAKFRRENISLKDGTSLELATAESPSQRASITVQDLFIDEEDLYSTTGESSALEDFKGRTRSYGHWAKIARACQPKGGEESSIWRGITQGVEQLMCFEVRCPCCGKMQLMAMKNFIVLEDEKDPKVVKAKKLGRYRCPECKYEWTDHARDIAVSNGAWRPYSWTGTEFVPATFYPDATSVGFHVPGYLSRFVSLSDLVARRISAESSDDPVNVRQFFNDDLALPYSPTEMETDVDKLLTLRTPWLPPRTVPHGAVALTCGIDVQKRGFWYLVRAWMPSMASYVIDYGYLDNWDDVGKLCFETWYPVQGPDGPSVGETMQIWRAGIDSGGTETEGVFTRTEEVYMWVRANGNNVVNAVKGASRPQTMPVRWVSRERMPHNGRPIPGGLKLYLLDSGVFKTRDFGRMLNEDSKQPLRFHSEVDQILASHLSAERLVRRSGRMIWEQIHHDNHLLDCLMMSAACADATWTPSLPLYMLQLQKELIAENMQLSAERPHARRPKTDEDAKKRTRW